MRKAFIFYLLAVTFLFCLPVFSQETITLTTYYPAPYGVYKALKTNYLQMGTHDTAHFYDYLRLSKAEGAADDPGNYIAGFMWNDHGTTPWGDGDDFTIYTYDNPNTGVGRDILIHSRPGPSGPAYVYLSGAGVGIAHTPALLRGVENRLEVWGGAVIGAGYTSDGSVAQANGLLVEGSVGLGTNEPTEKLEIDGNIKLSGRVLDDTLWTNAPLVNGWENKPGFGIAPAGYVKDKLGYVHIRGTIRFGACPGVIFRLPEEYRPGGGVRIFTAMNCRMLGGPVANSRCWTQRVDITPSGEVRFPHNCDSTDQLHLDTIEFWAQN